MKCTFRAESSKSLSFTTRRFIGRIRGEGKGGPGTKQVYKFLLLEWQTLEMFIKDQREIIYGGKMEHFFFLQDVIMKKEVNYGDQRQLFVNFEA